LHGSERLSLNHAGAMLKELLTSALDNLMKDKASSAFNVISLALILTLGLFLLFNIIYEAGYDRHHEKADQLYRVVSVIRNAENEYNWNVSQASLAPELLRKYSDVINATRFLAIGPANFYYNGRQFHEKAFYIADSSVFRMFSFTFIEGSPRSALSTPFAIVLTRSVAENFFGDSRKAVGSKIRNDKGQTFTVTAIIKDVPGNSHFTFDALISANTGNELNTGWANFSAHTYIEIADNSKPHQVSALLNSIAAERLTPFTDELDVRISYRLQRLPDIHKAALWSDSRDESRNNEAILVLGSISLIILFTVIMLLVKTSYEERRFLMEDELKKKISRHRAALILQSVTESVCITVISFIISAGLIYFLLPVANDLISKDIPFCYLWNSSVLLGIIGVIFFAGIVGAVYPAMYVPKLNMLGKLKVRSIEKEEIFLV
jgi:putative ABC transport system permease protein